MDKGSNFSPTSKAKDRPNVSRNEEDLSGPFSRPCFELPMVGLTQDVSIAQLDEKLHEEVFERWTPCQSPTLSSLVMSSSSACDDEEQPCCSFSQTKNVGSKVYGQRFFPSKPECTTKGAPEACPVKALPLQEFSKTGKCGGHEPACKHGCIPKCPPAKESPAEALPLEWPTTRGSAVKFKRNNSLTVPRPLSCSLHLTKSISLTNLKSNTPDKGDSRDRAVSVPSSPDSFYCDSMYSSYGTVSVDLNCSSLMRSLSCGALSGQPPEQSSACSLSVASPRRSNSSDSAVVLPSEDERTPFLKACKLFVDLQHHLQPDPPVFSLDSPAPVCAGAKDQTIAPYGDRSPFPFFNAPSVVVSDHSDQDCISMMPAAEDFPSLDYPSLDFPSLEDSLCGDLCWHSSRKFSDCSTCSLASSLSVEDEELDEPQRTCCDEECKSQPSGWRKVRNIVHWSPFVQTYKKQKYPWVQLAGHQGSFKAGGQGTILKKLCPKEERCLLRLMKDDLWQFVPEYKGQVEGEDNEKYLQLQDLLKDFDNPCVMDCKIGVRTYLEEELAKAKEKCKLRKDMYEKMVQVDPTAPTEEENRVKGVTKPRYMVWRETISSTATLGFRIEGMKRGNGISSKDFKMIRTSDQVANTVRAFVDGSEDIVPHYLQRLRDLRNALVKSEFFKSHELIGSSLLFVHDSTKACIWMIDFAKTQPLPENVHIDHNSPWVVGNHEDGYLIGIDNLIHIFSSIDSIHHQANT